MHNMTITAVMDRERMFREYRFTEADACCLYHDWIKDSDDVVRCMRCEKDLEY